MSMTWFSAINLLDECMRLLRSGQVNARFTSLNIAQTISDGHDKKTSLQNYIIVFILMLTVDY